MLKLCVQHHAWTMLHWLPTSLRLIMMKKCPHEKQRKNMPKIYCKRAANKRTLEMRKSEREKPVDIEAKIGFALHRWLISNKSCDFFQLHQCQHEHSSKWDKTCQSTSQTDINFCSPPPPPLPDATATTRLNYYFYF